MLVRAVGRLARYFGMQLGWTAGGIALIWFSVWIFPFLFEGTKGFWEFMFGVEEAHAVVVGIACLMAAVILARSADITWRGVYLAPLVGESAAQEIPLSRTERLVIAVAAVEAVAIMFLFPGAYTVLDTTGIWLPGPGTPGVIGLTLILTIALGVTVFLGDLWVFSWRARPGHDLTRAT